MGHSFGAGYFWPGMVLSFSTVGPATLFEAFLLQTRNTSVRMSPFDRGGHWSDELVAEAEDLFKLLGRIDDKKPVVKEKGDIFLRSVKIHHIEEEPILQAMS